MWLTNAYEKEFDKFQSIPYTNNQHTTFSLAGMNLLFVNYMSAIVFYGNIFLIIISWNVRLVFNPNFIL